MRSLPTLMLAFALLVCAPGARSAQATPETGEEAAPQVTEGEEAPEAPATPAVPAPVEDGGATRGAAASTIFNPDISVTGSFVAAAGRSPGGGEPALQLDETEISLQSVVDPYARADFFLSAGPDGVALEEGYITFSALPGGVLVKVGRMRDAFGKVNGMHGHVLPSADRPIVSRSLTGGEDALADSGVSVSRLIPIPGVFLEATGQVYRGESEVFKAPTRGDLAYVGHLRLYRDLSESVNVDLGSSFALGHNGDDATTTTRLLGADATFRYKPLRRAIYTHVLARGELVWSRRESASVATQHAFGAYGYLEYQISRRWTIGVRYDDSERAADATLHDTGGSLILTFAPSEFSRVRGQYRHTRFGEGHTADELFLQIQFSIGAHGAHVF